MGPDPAARFARTATLAGIVLATTVLGCRGTVGTSPGSGSAGSGTTGAAGTGGAPTVSGGAGAAGGAPTISGPLVPGRAPLRRLTRVEYDNTVLRLLGDPSNPALQFEPDTLADGFTNNADTQNVGTNLAQQYLLAAETLSVTATKDLNKLLGCNPAGAEATCLRSFITQFGQRAWRRPLTAPEIDRLAAIYTKGRIDFDIPTSTQLVLQTLLLSPAFLYRVELGAPTPGATTFPLTSWELASRLSYFLEGSMPDDLLLTTAAGDGLRTPEQVAASARRLLSPSSRPAQDRMAQFFTEWMRLVNIDRLQRDISVFPTFTPALGPLMRQETETFVKKTLFGGPGDLGTLLTAPYTYAPPEIATLYGAAPPATDGRIALDPKRRAGLLTQPAILATLAKADTTDPVHRGKFVWEGLFCGSVPAPPPNINVTPPKITPGTTARTRFEQHRAADACAACHVVMDPIGLTFENYDALGRWRDTENGLAIDASGQLKGTDVDGPFVGAVELAHKLASSPRVATCAVRQLFRFGYGRYDTDEDLPTIETLAAQFQSSQQRFIDLAVAMTQVPAFLQLQVAP
jgi:Protein of unknown function (DUF1588)/Protein of unknown function (DUF1592)/Protein of unknown function (DUF1595)/Protein of unknown function (DUF1587)/Protein of unknown function (DUF1585)